MEALARRSRAPIELSNGRVLEVTCEIVARLLANAKPIARQATSSTCHQQQDSRSTSGRHH
jgi:hypothetical protein